MLSVMFLGANGPLQRRESGNTSLLIRTSNLSFLIDASVNLQEAVKEDIDVVLITHAHIDHIYGLPSLIHQLWLSGRTKKLQIILPEGIINTVDDLMNLFSLREKENIFPIELLKASSHYFESLVLECFPTDHTDSSIGLIIDENGKKILYTSDTRPIKNTDPKWLDADLVIHEASGLCKDETLLVKKGHSSALDAGKLASRIKAKKLFLCHLPSEQRQDLLKEAREQFSNSFIPEILSTYEV